MNKQLLISGKAHPNNFDFIRFVLASSVIFCHSYAIYYGYDKFLRTEPFMVWSHRQISIGSVAVDLFFIISGFLIVKSFETSSSVADYFKKRLLRIYPGFIAALLISYLVVGFLGSGLQADPGGYIHYLLELHKKKELVHMVTLQYPFQKVFFKGMPEPGLNDSVWTIQFEFVCYLLVPIFALIGVFKKRIFFILAFMIMYGLLFLQMKNYVFPYKNTDYLFFANPFHYPRFITYFLAGACAYFYRDKITRSHWLALLSFILVVFSFTRVKCVDQVLPIAGTYLLFYLVYHPGIRLSNFAKHGDFSYGVYLYGWPVQALIMYYLKDHLGPLQLCMIALPLAICAAFCSWHLVEKPFLKLKKSKPAISKPSLEIASAKLVMNNHYEK